MQTEKHMNKCDGKCRGDILVRYWTFQVVKLMEHRNRLHELTLSASLYTILSDRKIGGKCLLINYSSYRKFRTSYSIHCQVKS